MEPDRGDDALLAAAAADPEAFARFYRLHVGGVIAYFRRRVGSTELAADLTAETFAAAVEGRRRSPRARRPSRRRGSQSRRRLRFASPCSTGRRHRAGPRRRRRAHAPGLPAPNLVTNDATNQERARTTIAFERGHRTDALGVASCLHIDSDRVVAMGSAERSLSDGAQVAVFLGADRSR
jgi:hypothetical protein